MYYSSIGMLALFILLIENYDIIFMRSDNFEIPAWKEYRKFLLTLLFYYISDISWGILEKQKLAHLLFIDTSIYFLAMATGIFFLAKYIVTYLDAKNKFEKLLLFTGHIFSLLIVILIVINCFVPIFFSVDKDCTYHALSFRYSVLGIQIILLYLVSFYAIWVIITQKKNKNQSKRRRYRTLSLFGIIIATFLCIQMWFPYFPLYSIANMLGTCLFRTFVIGDEKEDYRNELKRSYEQARSSGTTYSHIARSLARGYIELYYINLDTEEYIKYHTDDELASPKEADRGFDFFNACKRDIEKYVYSEDRESVLKTIDRKNVLHSLDKNGTLTTTYRLGSENGSTYVNMTISRMEDDDSILVIGIMDADEQMKHRQAAERLKEESIAYNRISALTGDFLGVYVVIPDTGRYREYSTTSDYESLTLPKEGMDFYKDGIQNIYSVIYPDDLGHYLSLFKKENILKEIENNGIFAMKYRLLIKGRPVYVQLKIAIVEEKDGPRLIAGVSNIDAQVRQEQDYKKRILQAQKKANIDALTGVKNKHAFLDAEEGLNRMISNNLDTKFAIAILDVNDLKKVNDLEGHQAGDEYIRGACQLICETFKRSPVFRIGGDEFAVIAQENDYTHIDKLVKKINDHNKTASRSGGIVVACGMAKYDNDKSVAAVFERADMNMYENKSLLKAAKKE